MCERIDALPNVGGVCVCTGVGLQCELLPEKLAFSQLRIRTCENSFWHAKTADVTVKSASQEQGKADKMPTLNAPTTSLASIEDGLICFSHPVEVDTHCAARRTSC